MSDTVIKAVSNAKVNIWEFRMAIFWFLLFSVNSLTTAINGALMGTQWSTLDGQTKFMIVFSIASNWTGTIMAFTSKQANRIKTTGDLFPLGGSSDTQFLQQTTKISQTTEAPKT